MIRAVTANIRVKRRSMTSSLLSSLSLTASGAAWLSYREKSAHRFPRSFMKTVPSISAVFFTPIFLASQFPRKHVSILIWTSNRFIRTAMASRSRCSPLTELVSQPSGPRSVRHKKWHLRHPFLSAMSLLSEGLPAGLRAYFSSRPALPAACGCFAWEGGLYGHL